MGLFKFLDKLGGAGVKVNPAKLKPAAIKDTPADSKPATIEESLERFAFDSLPSYTEIQHQYIEKQKLAKKYASEAKSYTEEYSYDEGCDSCGSFDFSINTVEGAKICRACEYDKTMKMLNVEPPEQNEYENDGTLYDEGYNDGYAGYSPVYEGDKEYMMGYKDGEADQEFHAAEIEKELPIMKLTHDGTDFYDGWKRSCEQGQHMFKTHVVLVDSSQYIKCEKCGIIKHKKLA